MTRIEIEQELKDFVDLYCTEYAEASFEILAFDEDDPRQLDAAIHMTLSGPSNTAWEVPIGIDCDGALGIAACPDCDIYLNLDAGGLYAYLWIEAMRRLDALKETCRKSQGALERLTSVAEVLVKEGVLAHDNELLAVKKARAALAGHDPN